MKTAIVLLSIFALATARPEPRNIRAACDASFTSRTGTIQSPSYPSSYANDLDCTYTVQGSPGEIIRVTYNDFELESSSTCRYDYVELFDGDTSMRKDCGSSLPSVFETSTGNDLKLVFHSDYSITRKGFEISFSTETPPPPPQKPVSCGKVKVSDANRIVGGQDSKPNAIPWQVSLQKPTFSGSSTYYHFCGGSILSETFIVTAAHCVGTSLANDWEVIVGAHNVRASSESTRQKFTVKKATKHQSYDSSSYENDIAILELNSKIDLSSNFAEAICLPTEAIGPVGGINVIVSGWGTLSSGGSSPDILQYVSVPVVADAVCGLTSHYGNEFHSASMVCAGVTGKDSCQGDSGGPLYRQESSGDYVLNGVVSWGYGCAGANQPGVYARVYNYKSWISSTTGITF